MQIYIKTLQRFMIHRVFKSLFTKFTMAVLQPPINRANTSNACVFRSSQAAAKVYAPKQQFHAAQRARQNELVCLKQTPSSENKNFLQHQNARGRNISSFKATASLRKRIVSTLLQH